MKLKQAFKLIYRNCKRCNCSLATMGAYAHKETSQLCQNCITENKKKEVDKHFRENGPIWFNKGETR